MINKVNRINTISSRHPGFQTLELLKNVMYVYAENVERNRNWSWKHRTNQDIIKTKCHQKNRHIWKKKINNM